MFEVGGGEARGGEGVCHFCLVVDWVEGRKRWFGEVEWVNWSFGVVWCGVGCWRLEVGGDGEMRLGTETRFWRVAWSGGFSALLRWSRNAHSHIFREARVRSRRAQKVANNEN